MQIKKLELSGFKSFMTPATLEFGGGITAVLGPNGCGKSNVVDAVRWVLGEQSAKQLRGDKMMNVIFGGTRQRKPLSMAEVSVTFNNVDGRMPTPFQEVRITRRLSRDGSSDYLMNGAPCRLKDVRDLITDTGAGSHAYSIIEREMVDSVIQGHEDSRRFLLEEASGIMKYRLRRREAQRKLDMTGQDLLRLDDIIEEIGRTVRTLKRQMGRARRYQELQESLQRAETYLAQQRVRGYRDEESRLQAQLDDLQAVSVGEDAESDAVRARIEELRASLTAVETEWRTAGERCNEVAEQLRAEEESMLVLRERAESTRDAQASARGEIETIEQRLERVRADRADLGTRKRDLETRVHEGREVFRVAREKLVACEERFEQARSELLQVKQRNFDFAQSSMARRGEVDVLRSKLETYGERTQELSAVARDASERAARLAEELAALAKQIEGSEARRSERRLTMARLEERDEELVGVLESQREERAEARTQLDAQRSRLELMRALVDAYEGYGQGSRSLLERHAGTPQLLGSLGDVVRVPEDLEHAFDALLHDVLDALLVPDLDSALRLLDELRDQQLGRATFLVPGESRPEVAEASAALPEIPGVMGRAADLIRLEGPAAAALRPVLAHALVVEDARAARAVLRSSNDPRLRVATRDGVLFTAGGMLRGGSRTESEVGVLGRQQRLRELEDAVAACEQRLEEATRRCAASESALRQCRSERRELDHTLRDDEEQLQQLLVTQASLNTAFEECNARCGQAQQSLGELEAESERLARRLPELTQSAARLSEETDVQKQALRELEEKFEALEHEREEQRHATAELRVAFVELRGESESCARQAERLAELEQELVDLRGRRQQDVERTTHDLEHGATTLEATRGRAATLAAQLETARATRDEIALRLDAVRGQVEAQQNALHAIEKERREQQQRVHGIEMELSQARMRSANVLERMQEHYALNDAQLLVLRFEWSDDERLPNDDVVRELREALDRLGPVNLLALEEYEEKSQRLSFLEGQRADLVQASASLQETIDKINRTACFLFMETFDQVRAHFRETIRTVFDGGDGDLVLTNPGDPLETDVELRVRPRGKKIDTLTQLSSGERALTAIALLFSIYLVKPSPFCVFDEVDAPLDDANILRFVQLLDRFKDRTQFIVITHNKLTMEASDHLYGVTMEEEGVSKLVSVALDGKLRGQSKELEKRSERVSRAIALLHSTSAVAEEFAGDGNGNRGGNGEKPRARPAARVDASHPDDDVKSGAPGNGGNVEHTAQPEERRV